MTEIIILITYLACYTVIYTCF